MRLAALLLTILPAFVAAQSTPSASPAGALIGIVRDSAGHPLDRVDVTIAPSGRSARTRSDGAFRLDRLDSGTYTVVARRFGFVPAVRSVDVGSRATSIEIRLIALANALPTVVTSAVRGGLSGIVVDSARRPLSAAHVTVLAANGRAVTDSSGAFAVPLRAGRYMVRVQRAGYVSRLVSVNVPRDSGRRIVVGLRQGTDVGGGREAAIMDALRLRLLRHTGPLGLFSHEDLLKAGNARLEQLAAFAVVHPVDASCMASIDGDASNQVPIWTLDSSMLEFLEVYPGLPQEPGPFQRTRRTSSTGGCPAIIAWLRR